jgi:hypothetical protein
MKKKREPTYTFSKKCLIRILADNNCYSFACKKEECKYYFDEGISNEERIEEAKKDLATLKLNMMLKKMIEE